MAIDGTSMQPATNGKHGYPPHPAIAPIPSIGHLWHAEIEKARKKVIYRCTIYTCAAASRGKRAPADFGGISNTVYTLRWGKNAVAHSGDRA